MPQDVSFRERNRYSIGEEPEAQALQAEALEAQVLTQALEAQVLAQELEIQALKAVGFKVKQDISVIETQLRLELKHSLIKVLVLTILVYFITWISITSMTEDFFREYYLEVTCVYMLAFCLCYHYFLRGHIEKAIGIYLATLGIKVGSYNINLFHAIYFILFMLFYFIYAILLDLCIKTLIVFIGVLQSYLCQFLLVVFRS